MHKYGDITKFSGILHEYDKGTLWELNSKTGEAIKLRKSNNIQMFFNAFSEFRLQNQVECLSDYKQFLRKSGIDLDILRLEDIYINRLNAEEILSIFAFLVDKEEIQEGYFIYFLNKGIVNKLLDRLISIDR